jgi:hypothetical protein
LSSESTTPHEAPRGQNTRWPGELFFLLSPRLFIDDIFSLVALASLALAMLPCAPSHPPSRSSSPLLSPLPLVLSSPHHHHYLQPHRGCPALPPSQSHYRPPHALTNALDDMCEPSACRHRASPSTGDDDDSTLY